LFGWALLFIISPLNDICKLFFFLKKTFKNLNFIFFCQNKRVIGLIGVVAVWLVLFRAMPNVLVVKGFRFNRRKFLFKN